MNKLQQAEFDRWYLAFPKKVSVGAAKKKWEQISPNQALVDKMIEAVKFQTEEYLKENGQQSGAKAFKYFQGPAPWLNSEAWENEVIKKKEYIKRDKLCGAQGCNQPATNAGKLGVFYCVTHWDGHDPERADLLKTHFISLNIRQDENGWKAPCLAYIKRLGGFGGLVGDG